MKITKKQISELVESALKAKNNAYHPCTKYGVGAAVLTEDNEIYAGANVQSVISGLGTCAERAAIDHAVAHGKYKFRAIAVAFDSGKFVLPCGACLQYINEFSQVSGKDIAIILVNKNGKYKKTSLKKIIKGLWGPIDGGFDISKYTNRK